MIQSIILCLFLSLSVLAQEETVKEQIQEVPQQVSGSDLYRDQSLGSVMLGYQVLTTWIPFKWTASYNHIFNKKWTAELEYTRGNFGIGAFGFDVASVSENRYSLLARRYLGNSFHWILGAFKNDFHAELGSSIVNDMTNTSIDDFRVQGIGVTVGIGNRWQWGNGFTLGLDWIRMNVPLLDKKVDNKVLDRIDDNSDLSTVKKYIRRIENVPTFVLLGINLGYTF